MARSGPDPAGALHLVVGAEPPVLARTLEKIREAHGLRPGDSTWEEIRLDGGDLGPEAVHAAVAGGSLFASRRLVLIRRVEELSPDAREVLTPLLAPLPPGLVLVVSVREAEPRDPLFKALRKGQVWELTPPSRTGDLVRWTRAQAAAEGVDLSPEAARRLVDAVGGEPSLIPGEVAKLAVYREGAGQVMPADVEALVSTAWSGLPRYAVFDLVDAVSRGDAGTALERFRALIRRGEEPLRILAMVGRQWHLLAVTLGLQAEGRARAEELVRETGIKTTFEAGKLLQLAAFWDEARLARAVELTAAADLELKQGAHPSVTLELLLLRLARLSGGREGRPAAG